MDAQRAFLGVERTVITRLNLLDCVLQLQRRVAAGGHPVGRGRPIETGVFRRFDRSVIGQELKFGFSVHALIVEQLFGRVNSLDRGIGAGQIVDGAAVQRITRAIIGGE